MPCIYLAQWANARAWRLLVQYFGDIGGQDFDEDDVLKSLAKVGLVHGSNDHRAKLSDQVGRRKQVRKQIRHVFITCRRNGHAQVQHHFSLPSLRPSLWA